MTEHTTPGGPASADDNPDAQGIRSKLSDAQRAMLDSKSRGGGSGLQSVGKNHKPTHASGKQGPVEKKVRW